MTNIHFIRAAILSNTGINLTLDETMRYLIEEGLLSEAKSKGIIFRGYSAFYDYFYKQDDNLIAAKKERAVPLDVVEIMNATDETVDNDKEGLFND